MRKIHASSKRVLLMGINFAPELTGIGKYTGEMVDWLVDNDYQCTVVTGFPYYPNWKIHTPYKGTFFKKEVKEDGKLIIYRCPLYIPGQPSGLKRVFQEMTFFLTSFIMICYLLFKRGNQKIFCMAPPFHLGLLALFYRFFKGGKVVYHIQDLQIEAARDLKVLKFDSVFQVFFLIEKFILTKVNYISTISHGMLKVIGEKVNREILFFPNWVDVSSFFPIPDKSALKKQWGFHHEDKVVLYSGSIGEKQGLDCILTIAKNLAGMSKVKFLICGTGPYKEKLENDAQAQGLKNVFFLPLQPISQLNSLLNMSDVHLVLQKKETGELMLPSKLSAILSVGGLALVTAEPGTSLHATIKENRMGVVINCDDVAQLQETILQCCSSSNAITGINARLYAERHLNKEVILKRIMLSVKDKHEVSVPAIDMQYGNAS